MAAAVLRVADGRVTSARLGLGGVEGTPRRVTEAERVLVGSGGGAETIEEAARTAAEAIDPTSDIHGSAGYRRRLVHAMARRALQDAVGRLEMRRG